MSDPLFIIGCGGFGREVHQLGLALSQLVPQWSVAGFVDDCPSPENLARVRALGSQHVGDVAWLAERVEPFRAVIAIGDPSARQAVAQRLAAAPVAYPVLVHPDATVGRDVEVGPGCVIAAGARLSTNIRLGAHVHVDQNATVGHDCTLGAYTRLNPQACVSGSVTLGKGATVGASATVLPGLDVGVHAVIGAGACVVRPVQAHAVVKGVPAR